MENLSDFVMIAGPNGCGKSCVFDAIRLLKSIYGGYSPNEWHHFFAELQIDLNRPVDIRRLFRDPSEKIVIEATVELGEEERSYLADNAEAVLESFIWMQVTGADPGHRRFAQSALLVQSEAHSAEIREQMARRLPAFKAGLADATHSLSVTMTADVPRINHRSNDIVASVFATYDPEHLGLVEYHSASRTYQREALGGIDLNVQAFEDVRRQSGLYNWQNKYSNIKTELAATYLRGLIAQEADSDSPLANVNDTINELFRQFLPDKEYLGVTPEIGGTVSFPVRLKSGDVHDINELSSGEKELVYGYLRLRNSAPRNSVILIDEPELHLNPGLLKGLVTFYHQNLGRSQENQLWLVTHSDALLRQAVIDPSMSVFHMSPLHALLEDSANQASAVVAEDELERATIAIVGDLATYKPSARVVILEGGGDTEFDVDLVATLAPDFAKRVNLISGGDRRRVHALYETLARSGERLGAKGRFFAIVDSDSDPDLSEVDDVDSGNDSPAQYLTWGVYHIENFLLEDSFIRLAVNTILRTKRFESDAEVAVALEASAAKIVNHLVYERVRTEVSTRIVSSIKVAGKADLEDTAGAIHPSIKASFRRLEAIRIELDEPSSLAGLVSVYREKFEAALGDGSWRSVFPGRRILTQFAVDTFGQDASYETLRNVIIDKMENASFQPAGMGSVIDAIIRTEVEA